VRGARFVPRLTPTCIGTARSLTRALSRALLPRLWRAALRRWASAWAWAAAPPTWAGGTRLRGRGVWCVGPTLVALRLVGVWLRAPE
jgi:hypothetical protein